MVKQQNVVFFIGAGFSAPFGLPVMSNFINKAKDLYFFDGLKYKDIEKTLKLIEKFSVVKNYMAVDLHNIEDLLSIAYMESVVSKNSRALNDISSFIKTVINAYTGSVRRETLNFTNLVSNISLVKGSTFIPSSDGNRRVENFEMLPKGKKYENTNFGIISLNYDMIIENSLSALADEYGKFYSLANRPNPLKTHFSTRKLDTVPGIAMAKLHGSIDSHIVPPTWNKNVNANIQDDWKLATRLLIDATHVIFVGYSLPSSDNYIKYLLASSLNRNKRLKKITVVTMDGDGNTMTRYNSLFATSPSFHNVDTMLFFNALKNYDASFDFDSFDKSFSAFCNQQK